MARLKTYWAEIDGLHDWIVAAPNMKTALEAFGVNQDLFAQGRAGVADDEAKVAAAAEHPGVALRKAKGRKGAFEPIAGSADWSDALTAARKKPKPKASPNQARLARARKALAALEEAGSPEVEALEKEREALDRRIDKARAAYDAKLDRARAAVEAAKVS